MTRNQASAFDLDDTECWVIALFRDDEPMGHGQRFTDEDQATRRAVDLRVRYGGHAQVKVFHGCWAWDEVEAA